MVGEVGVGEGVDGEVVRACRVKGGGRGVSKGDKGKGGRGKESRGGGVGAGGKKKCERDGLQERRPWPTCASDPVQCCTSVLFPEPVVPRTRMKTGVWAVCFFFVSGCLAPGRIVGTHGIIEVSREA